MMVMMRIVIMIAVMVMMTAAKKNMVQESGSMSNMDNTYGLAETLR